MGKVLVPFSFFCFSLHKIYQYGLANIINQGVKYYFYGGQSEQQTTIKGLRCPLQDYIKKVRHHVMKATGIVRRIDDLGRVVIPKEIRRTLRIREGDPLEIFVDRDGEVILKKYSPIGELGDFAKEYAEALFESLRSLVLISDRDAVIAVAGGSRKDYHDKAVGDIVEQCMEERKTMVENREGDYELVKDYTEHYSGFVIAPIIAGGDPIGAVILVEREGKQVSQLEEKMAETAAYFLAKQMEQ